MTTSDEQRIVETRLPLSDEDEAKIRRIAESRERLKISLMNDFAFKTVLHNKIVLKGLLSAMLKIPVDEILELEFPDTIMTGEFPDDKTGILDIRIYMNENKKINIELQVLPFPYWEERTLFYLCKLFVHGFRKGMRYNHLEDCIHISILKYNLLDDGEFYSTIGFYNRKTGRIYSDKLSLRVLQLGQIERATEEEKQSLLYLWAKMISTDDWEVLEMLAKENEYMKEAVDELEKINSDPAKRYDYLYHEIKEMDEATIRDYFTQKGMEQGLQQGLQKGKADEEDRHNRLILKLAEAGRLDEIVNAAAHPAFLEILYQEFEL